MNAGLSNRDNGHCSIISGGRAGQRSVLDVYEIRSGCTRNGAAIGDSDTPLTTKSRAWPGRYSRFDKLTMNGPGLSR